jgi:hypothetical protein
VELIKVKAHNGDFFNDKADMLAKETLSLPSVKINHQETGSIISPPIWNNIPIDISIRDFVKELNKKSINYQWTSQDRNKKLFSEEITNEESYEWDFLWNKQRKKRNATSINSSKRKSFWIKITQNELPTLNNLAIRKPKLYKEHQICPLCLNEKETRNHLLRCSATQRKLEDIWPKIEIKLLEGKKGDKDKSKVKDGKRALLNKFKRRVTNFPQEYLKIFIGLIGKEDVKELQDLTNLSTNNCKEFISDFSDKLRNQFHDDVWSHRCNEIIAMKKTLGISNKVKKAKITRDSESRRIQKTRPTT